eukprot:UN07644
MISYRWLVTKKSLEFHGKSIPMKSYPLATDPPLFFEILK